MIHVNSWHSVDVLRGWLYTEILSNGEFLSTDFHARKIRVALYIRGWLQFHFKLYAEKERSSVSNPLPPSCSTLKPERHRLAQLDRKPYPKQLQKVEVISKEILRLRTERFWVITQSVVVISYRCFATTYRARLFGFFTPDDGTDRLSRNVRTHCVITQKSAVVMYFAAEAWIHASVSFSHLM
jgi:hypothetical protein